MHVWIGCMLVKGNLRMWWSNIKKILDHGYIYILDQTCEGESQATPGTKLPVSARFCYMCLLLCCILMWNLPVTAIFNDLCIFPLFSDHSIRQCSVNILPFKHSDLYNTMYRTHFAKKLQMRATPVVPALVLSANTRCIIFAIRWHRRG